MGLIFTDPLDRVHQIESLEDPFLGAMLDSLSRSVKELLAENTELTISVLDANVQKGFAEIKLRRTEKELTELQHIVDTSISNLDPDRG